MLHGGIETRFGGVSSVDDYLRRGGCSDRGKRHISGGP
jgi:hypothetical protein